MEKTNKKMALTVFVVIDVVGVVELIAVLVTEVAFVVSAILVGVK